MNNSNKGAKILLYLLFGGLLVAAIVLAVIAILNPDKREFVPDVVIPPDEIVVDESEKYNIKIEGEVVKMSPDVDLAQERINHNNNEIIGRLEVPDMFNVLVVKGINNESYLTINIDLKKDVMGATFMDYRVDPNSSQINIYGHNSRDVNLDVPFRRLEKFLDKTYFDSNPYIIFQYDGGKRVYKITSITEVYKDNKEHMRVMKTGDDFVNHINTIISNPINSRSVPFDANSKVIILQTCSHHLDNAVYLITGIAINYIEE